MCPTVTLPTIAAYHATLSIAALALAVLVYGLTIPATVIWAAQAPLIILVDYEQMSPFLRECYAHIGYAWMATTLVQYMRDDGTEGRVLDDSLTKHGFHRLAKLNRKFDYWRTPWVERRLVEPNAEVWEGINRSLQDFAGDEVQLFQKPGIDILRGLPCSEFLDRYEKMLDCCSKTQTTTIKLFRCCSKMLSCCQETGKRYVKTLRAYLLILKCYGELRRIYSKVLLERRYLRLKTIIETMERFRDIIAKHPVWERAWVRPFRQDLDRGIKYFHEVIAVLYRHANHLEFGQLKHYLVEHERSVESETAAEAPNGSTCEKPEPRPELPEVSAGDSKTGFITMPTL